MSEHVYKNIELTGSSKVSVEDAIKNAITKAGESVHNMRWYEVCESRGSIKDGRVDQFQVTLKIGFALDD